MSERTDSDRDEDNPSSGPMSQSHQFANPPEQDNFQPVLFLQPGSYGGSSLPNLSSQLPEMSSQQAQVNPFQQLPVLLSLLAAAASSTVTPPVTPPPSEGPMANGNYQQNQANSLLCNSYAPAAGGTQQYQGPALSPPSSSTPLTNNRPSIPIYMDRDEENPSEYRAFYKTRLNTSTACLKKIYLNISAVYENRLNTPTACLLPQSATPTLFPRPQPHLPTIVRRFLSTWIATKKIYLNISAFYENRLDFSRLARMISVPMLKDEILQFCWVRSVFAAATVRLSQEQPIPRAPSTTPRRFMAFTKLLKTCPKCTWASNAIEFHERCKTSSRHYEGTTSELWGVSTTGRMVSVRWVSMRMVGF
jgi:hypothetical protein